MTIKTRSMNLAGLAQLTTMSTCILADWTFLVPVYRKQRISDECSHWYFQYHSPAMIFTNGKRGNNSIKCLQWIHCTYSITVQISDETSFNSSIEYQLHFKYLFLRILWYTSIIHTNSISTNCGYIMHYLFKYFTTSTYISILFKSPAVNQTLLSDGLIPSFGDK